MSKVTHETPLPLTFNIYSIHTDIFLLLHLPVCPTFHMGRVLHDGIACSIKKQFALMKKKRLKIWAIKLVMHFNSWSDRLDKCMSGLQSEWERRSEPELVSSWFIHSNGEVSFPSCVGAQDRRMGGRSRGLNSQSNSWPILLFFLSAESFVECESWSNRCASSYLAGANSASGESHFFPLRPIVHPEETFDIKSFQVI